MLIRFHIFFFISDGIVDKLAQRLVGIRASRIKVLKSRLKIIGVNRPIFHVFLLEVARLSVAVSDRLRLGNVESL